MCGIVGYIGERDCGPILLDALRRQEYRGYDSAGIAIFDGERLQRRRAEGKLNVLQARVAKSPVHGTVGIGHTRWATHGRPTEQNAHPHMVDGVVLVHNGIIENHMELRHELEAAGAEFESETDTEIVAHMLARSPLRATSLLDALRDVLRRVRGSYAIIALDERRPDVIVGAQNAAPLLVGRGEGEQFFASDVPAIMQQTRDVVFLQDGDFATIRANAVTFYNDEGKEIERPTKKITWDPVSAEKQGYRHFMLKEIHEQPQKIVDTLRGRISLERNAVEFHDVTLNKDWLRSVDQVIFLACGTSYHAGLVGTYALEQLCGVHVRCELASEFRTRTMPIDARTLVIPISQSGETADTLAATKKALQAGAKALAVCNVMESSLTRVCGSTLYTQAGPEIGVASTKAFTTQLAVLYLFSLWFGNIRGQLSQPRCAELLMQLRAIPGHMEQCIAQADAITEFASAYADAQSFLFLGRSYQYPIALEGALKLKEISYIHAEGYAAGELKHGPIALIDENVPVVVIAPNNTYFEKALSNLEEVRARGARVIAVTSGEINPRMQKSVAHMMIIPEVDEILEPLLTVIPLQLLAYAIADFKGTDIDQPRNLAKSVTVE